jgi:hypothetical protein
MHIPDPSFSAHNGLSMALELLASQSRDSVDLPRTLPESGQSANIYFYKPLPAVSSWAPARGAPTGSPVRSPVRSVMVSSWARTCRGDPCGRPCGWSWVPSWARTCRGDPCGRPCDRPCGRSWSHPGHPPVGATLAVALVIARAVGHGLILGTRL